MDNQQNNVNVPQFTEEQLKRMYKGVEFRSEEEKNNIIAIEQDIMKYCENFDGKTCKELHEKHQELMKLPNAIFMPYAIKLMAEIGEKEKDEVAKYIEKIDTLSLEELDGVKVEVSSQHYSSEGINQIDMALVQRKRECQTKIFEDMLIGYTSLSRMDLKDLKKKVSEKNFEASITNTYLNKIDVQYDVVEQNELQMLCANVDNMEMKELEGALRIINEGGYQEKYSASYIMMINNRIEYLQYKELEAMTAGKENMSRQELQELYDKLEQGSYNPKFVKRFLVDLRMLIEKNKYNEVMALTADVCNKSKEEVLEIEKNIGETGYSPEILLIPRKRIDDKKFEFDMHELIDRCNDFDSLSDAKADEIIADISQRGYSQKSLNIYFTRIAERKMNIALADISRLSTYFVQLANKYGIGGGDILVASKSDAFMNAFKNLKSAYPASGEYDIPAFIMNGGVNIAISYKYCYLNMGNKQNLIDVNNIKCMKTIKKFFMESLVIELKDGSTVSVAGNINKQIVQAFLQMMNEFVMNVNNESMLAAYAMPVFNVEPLNKEWYVCKDNGYELSKTELEVMTIGVICNGAATREMEKAMHFAGNKDWEQYQVKVKTNYQLQPTENLIFVYDKTLLNSAKEGFAVSEDKLLVKRASQPVYSINMKDVFAVKCDAAGKICIETTGLDTVTLDMVTVSVNCAQFVSEKLDKYVKAMQLFETVCS